MGIEKFDAGRRRFLQTGVTLAAGAVLGELVGNTDFAESYLLSPKEVYNEAGDTVLLFADVHVGEKDTRRQASLEALSTLKRTVNSLLPYHFELVAQLGDMIKETRDHQTNMDNVKATIRQINRLDADKFVHMLGNHDVWRLTDEDLRQAYQEAHQKSEFYGLHDLTYHQIVWLDLEAENGKNGRLRPERLEWLRDTVDPLKPIIIMSHYGILPQSVRNNYYFDDAPDMALYANHEEIWAQIGDLPVKAVISGHVHWGAYRKTGNTYVITLPAFSENIAGRNTDYNPGVYTIMHLTETGLSLQSFSGSYPFLSFELD